MKHQWLIYIIFLYSAVSCKKTNDFDKLVKPDWQPELAVPIINSEVSTIQLLNQVPQNDVVHIDNESKISLNYKDELTSFKGSELIDVEDLNQILLDTLNSLIFNFGKDKLIEALELSEGILEYEFYSQDTNDLVIYIDIPLATLNGVPFHQQINSEYIPGVGHSVKETINLENYSINLTQNNGNYNTLDVFFEVLTIIGNNNITGDNPLGISFNNLKFSTIFGYLGKLNFTLFNDTIDLTVFDNWISGSITLIDPNISLQINNSFGFPITAQINSINETGNSNNNLNSPLINTPFLVNYPEMVQIGDYESTVIILDDNNSDISNFISISPNKLNYSLSFESNINGDTTLQNFMTADSDFHVDIDLNLPMYGTIDNIVVRDTFEFDPSQETALNSLVEANFKLNTKNYFPFDVAVQIYFVDENLTVTDSLLSNTEKILLAGSINSDGRVIFPQEKITYIDFTQNRINNLKESRFLILQLKANSTNSGNDNIQLYSDYKTTIGLSSIFKTIQN